MLALIVPVTLEKLPAINEKYDMAKALEDNVLQNYVKASSDAKQEKNPDEILQEKAGFEDDLRIELPDDSEGDAGADATLRRMRRRRHRMGPEAAADHRKFQKEEKSQ